MVMRWAYKVTVTYENDDPVSVTYDSLEHALGVVHKVIDSPTGLCPTATVERVRSE